MAAPKAIAEPKAYLFRGDGDFQKAIALKELLDSIVSPDFADFDLEELEGNTATCDRIMAGMNVPPFGSDRRVVLVRYANKIDKEQQKFLAEKLASAPDQGFLILHTPAADKVDGKPVKGSDVVGELSKAVRKVGKVWELPYMFGKERATQTKQFARGLFDQAGFKVDPDALELLQNRVGDDFNTIGTEVEKLLQYTADKRRVTKKDVSEVTCETAEERVFSLIDAIGARNQSLALHFVENLFEQGGDPRGEAPRMLSMIARQLRLIWQTRILHESGIRGINRASTPTEIVESFPASPNLFDVVSTKAWMARKLFEQAAMFTFPQLARCFEEVEQADMMLKGMVESGTDDATLVMEMLVVKLAASGKPSQL